MRNLRKKLLMIVMVMTSFLSFGNTESGFENTITILNNTHLKVDFKDVKKGQVLTVISEDGTKVYSEVVKTSGKLVKVIDLSHLENGNYKIELEQDFQIIVNEVKISDNKVKYIANKSKVIFKPVIRTDNELLMVSKIAFDEKPLQLAIYFNNEVIYSETLKSDSIIAKAYRLQKDIEGPYKVVLYNNNRSYTHNFKI